jgi:hypothetical protein
MINSNETELIPALFDGDDVDSYGSPAPEDDALADGETAAIRAAQIAVGPDAATAQAG